MEKLLGEIFNCTNIKASQKNEIKFVEPISRCVFDHRKVGNFGETAEFLNKINFCSDDYVIR